MSVIEKTFSLLHTELNKPQLDVSIHLCCSYFRTLDTHFKARIASTTPQQVTAYNQCLGKAYDIATAQRDQRHPLPLRPAPPVNGVYGSEEERDAHESYPDQVREVTVQRTAVEDLREQVRLCELDPSVYSRIITTPFRLRAKSPAPASFLPRQKSRTPSPGLFVGSPQLHSPTPPPQKASPNSRSRTPASFNIDDWLDTKSEQGLPSPGDRGRSPSQQGGSPSQAPMQREQSPQGLEVPGRSRRRQGATEPADKRSRSPSRHTYQANPRARSPLAPRDE
ncbi:hypothetical protein P389DRAFT_177195 [Cystobasidium minutum MCA 4210]|uniref:uncharacterized protein n=1 Tax=Cystobasidium minutum MCA 4210 TaxID=1397322 RepID=UPI0034CD6B4C|eukprot:jgi/Rhomi1/177195/fgenesh1_pg.1_\